MTKLYEHSSRKKTSNKIRKRGEVTPDSKEIQKIVRKHYKQLYANKLDNLYEMGKFLEIYSFPKLNKEESENLNRQIPTTETEAVIKKDPNKNRPGPNGLPDGFYQTFTEELTPLLLKLFEKIQEDGRLPSSFYKASIILIPKPG